MIIPLSFQGGEILHIISIDDNQNNLLLIESYCEEIEGVRVTSFTDPVKALMRVLQDSIDLIVIDYMMPGLNGIEFVKEYRKHQMDVPIIMVTAAGDDDDLHCEALQAGVNDFLVKPVNAILFKARVKNLLDLRRSHVLLNDKAKHLESEVEKATLAITERELEALDTLGKTAEYKDPETGEHIARVAHYSKMLAEGYGLDDELQSVIFHASPFHDIGKIGIPDKILLKPGRLDEEEFNVMKTHPLIGYEILKKTTSKYLQSGSIIALSHHEKFDGSGYPKGLLGNDIPIEGRIVAVADVFDALTSKRPYKEPWSFDKALAFLQEESGKHFDPKLIEIFMANIDRVKEIFETFQEDNNI